MAVPPSWRRGDIEVLIAQQQLHVTVVEQLHQARLAFYTAIYDRDLQRLRTEQRTRLEKNAGSQKDRYESGLVDRGAFVSAKWVARWPGKARCAKRTSCCCKRWSAICRAIFPELRMTWNRSRPNKTPWSGRSGWQRKTRPLWSKM